MAFINHTMYVTWDRWANWPVSRLWPPSSFGVQSSRAMNGFYIFQCLEIIEMRTVFSDMWESVNFTLWCSWWASSEHSLILVRGRTPALGTEWSGCGRLCGTQSPLQKDFTGCDVEGEHVDCGARWPASGPDSVGDCVFTVLSAPLPHL